MYVLFMLFMAVLCRQCRYAALTFDDKRTDIIPEYDSPYAAKRKIGKVWESSALVITAFSIIQKMK